MSKKKETYSDLEQQILDCEEQVKVLNGEKLSLNYKLNESQTLSHIGSWNWDLKNNVINWSDMMFTLLGLEPNSVEPSYKLALSHVHDDDKVEYEKTLEIAVKNKQDYYFENRVTKKDKSVIFVISRGTCVLDKNNELIRMVGTVQDITEIKEYIESNTQLEQFANVTSHDLKAPLMTISNYVSLLKRNSYKKFNGEEKKYFDFIESRAKQMHNLIEDILNFSRINSPELNLVKINIEEFINNLKEDLATCLIEKNATIKLNPLPKHIIADRIKLRQVFQNLFTNAIKFSRSNVIPFIVISYKENEQDHMFVVQDNGLGIEEEKLNDIFEPYKQIQNKETYNGTGMGLSITKKIISAHGGNISVISSIGVGSTFYFNIPKKVESECQVV